MFVHIIHVYRDGQKIKVCAWLREISSCSCLTVLPGLPGSCLAKQTNLYVPLCTFPFPNQPALIATPATLDPELLACYLPRTKLTVSLTNVLSLFLSLSLPPLCAVTRRNGGGGCGNVPHRRRRAFRSPPTNRRAPMRERPNGEWPSGGRFGEEEREREMRSVVALWKQIGRIFGTVLSM